MQQLFTAFPSLFDRLPDTPDLRLAMVKAAWKKEAGEALQGHTKVISLDGTNLVVAVSDDSWSRQLGGLADKFVFALNRRFKRKLVERIEFVVSEEARSGRTAEQESRDRSFRPDTSSADNDLIAAASKIKDPELRQLILRTSALSAARQRTRQD